MCGGRQSLQNEDYTIALQHMVSVNGLTRVPMSKERHMQSTYKLAEQEQHDYRSWVGPLAWPACRKRGGNYPSGTYPIWVTVGSSGGQAS